MLSLREGLTHESTCPQGESALDPRVDRDGGAHAFDHEGRLAEVLAHFEDEGLRVRVEILGDLAIEVDADPVAHIGLDETLQPVARCCHLVESLEGAAEGLHGGGRIDPHLPKALAKPREMTELRRGHGGQLGLVIDGRCERRIRGKTLEGHELAVRQDAQEIDDGHAIRIVTA